MFMKCLDYNLKTIPIINIYAYSNVLLCPFKVKFNIPKEIKSIIGLYYLTLPKKDLSKAYRFNAIAVKFFAVI